jgi:hypothetical protein
MDMTAHPRHAETGVAWDVAAAIYERDEQNLYKRDRPS